MDACYRVINSITSDYATISYLKDWDKSDKSNIINFKSELTYKFEQIMNLSPDIYQFRIFISNPSFPEIGSILYSDVRLSNKQTIIEGLKNNPNGLWIFNHKEENYNTGYLERRNVVSVFKPLIYSNYKGLGIAEVTVLTKTFFRHLFSQPENEVPTMVYMTTTDQLQIVMKEKSLLIFNDCPK